MDESRSVEDLVKENESLRQQLARRSWAERLVGAGAAGAASLAVLVVVGPRLVDAMRRWVETHRREPGRLHVDETADVLAAIVRRVVAVGALALVAALLSTALHVHQNWLLMRQNEKLDTQNHLVEAQRRAGLMFELTSILEAVESLRKEWARVEPADVTRLKNDVATQLKQTPGESETELIVNRHVAEQFGVAAVRARQQARAGDQAALRQQALSDRLQRLENLADAQEMKQALEAFQRRGQKPMLSVTGGLVPDPLWLADGMVGRVVALSIALRPYRYLALTGERKPDTDRVSERAEEEGPTLVRAALSPERGQLLQTLVRSGVAIGPIVSAGAEFRFADLRFARLERRDMSQVQLSGADLSDAVLESLQAHGIDLQEASLQRSQAQFAVLDDANLRRARLDRVVLTRASLREAVLQEASLRGANLSGADLTGSNLVDADLQGTYLSPLLAGADLRGARLDGAIAPDARWIDQLNALTPVPKGWDASRWQLKQELAKGLFHTADGETVWVLRPR